MRLTPSKNGVFISDLHVAPEHRRHGLAKQLVQAAMRTARSRGYSVAQLEARPSPGADLSPNALVSMYQKMGFRNTGQTHRGNPLMGLAGVPKAHLLILEHQGVSATVRRPRLEFGRRIRDFGRCAWPPAPVVWRAHERRFSGATWRSEMKTPFFEGVNRTDPAGSGDDK